jgi:membrane protein DedA with SNARE-associated domain
MAGGRALGGVAAGAGSGAGVPGLLGLLVLMEAGVPVPVPSDLVMLLLGERVSAGALPLWLAMVLLELVALAGTAALFLAARGPGRALIARFGPGRALLAKVESRFGSRAGSGAGLPALVTGRTTPGLRTVTVVAAAGSGIRAGRALAALVLGSSLFLQAHLLLGYLLGPAAREVLEEARVPVLAAAGAVLAVIAVVVVARRRRGRVARVLAEGACPACLALGLGRPEPVPVGVAYPDPPLRGPQPGG